MKYCPYLYLFLMNLMKYLFYFYLYFHYFYLSNQCLDNYHYYHQFLSLYFHFHGDYVDVIVNLIYFFYNFFKTYEKILISM